MLRLRVGLEVSVCTGNAQRISLWEALRLANVFFGSTSSIQSRIPEVATCSHQIGDTLCVQECWVRSDGPKPITNKDARVYILTALSNLQFTGLDKDNALHLWWPFTQEPNTLPVTNNWVHMLKDSRDSATFAVMSPRCLEYEYVSIGNKSKVWRRCLDSKENQTQLHNFEQKGVVTNRNRTLLYTTLQLHPTACHLRNASYTMEHSDDTTSSDSGQTIGVVSTHVNKDKSTVGVGSQVDIDGIGTLEVMNEEQPPLTFRKKVDVLEKMTDLFKRDKRLKYRELISAEKAVGSTTNVVVM
jgi:hypothetical protein